MKSKCFNLCTNTLNTQKNSNNFGYKILISLSTNLNKLSQPSKTVSIKMNLIYIYVDVCIWFINKGLSKLLMGDQIYLMSIKMLKY